MTDTNTVYEGLKARGFEIWYTGGGCSAWGKVISDDGYVLISDDASSDLSDGAIIVVHSFDRHADPFNSWDVNCDQILEYADIAAHWLD